MKKFCLSIIVLVCTSCIEKKDCKIEPISSKTLDEKFWYRDIVFTNGEEYDTLLFVNKIDILTDTSVKAISNYEECGHLIEFEYKFSKNNEPLEIRVEKKENEKYIFSVKANCIKKDFHLDKSSILGKIMLKTSNCEFKEMTFNKLQIEYYKTSDNKIWKPL